MNAILSIFVCIAMLFSGGATLPAQPETATVWTLRNLSISTADGSATLIPEARLTTAIGSETALMQFEVVSGDEVLLPMACELTQDGLRFRLSDGGSVYSLSTEALPELLDEEEMQLMARLVDYLNSYGALLGRTMNDASFQQEVSRTMIDLLVSTCGGSAEPVTVELDGAELSAQRAQLEITPESALDLLDGIADCGLTEVEDMLNSWMGLLATATDEDYTSLSDFTAEQRELLDEEDEISIPMELTWTADEPLYLALVMDFKADDTSTVQLSFIESSTAEGADLDMLLRTTTDYGTGYTSAMDFCITGRVDGSMNAPESVQLHIEANSQSEWTEEYSEDGSGEDDAVGETYVYTSGNATGLALDVNATVTDGLERATIDLTGSESYQYGYEDDMDGYETSVYMHITADDRSEDDGSVTTAVTMDIDVDGENVQLSYELNRAEGMPLPSLDGSEAVELAEIIADDESGDASAALTSDLLRLSADATALGADESVLAALELLGVDPDALTDDYDVYDDAYDYDDDDWDNEYEYDGDDYDYDDDYDDDYGYDHTVYSMDEAAQIYEGVLPAFSVPGDLTLDYIDVSDFELDASYSSDDGERSMDLSFYDPGDPYGSFYILEDGALVDAGAVVALEALDEEGSVFDAEVVTENGNYSFSFYGFTQEEVKAVLATLQF